MNSIKYSTQNQSNALGSGNFYLGVGDVPKGPTSLTDYYAAINPPTSGYTIYLNKSVEGPAIYTPDNDDELITLTRILGGQSFTDASDCKEWFFGQDDKLLVNRKYEKIVTDELYFHVDAAFTPSYPTKGTKWLNMGKSGNDGTLTNGPTFDSDGGGNIRFDDSDDIVLCGSSNSLTGDNLQSCTISAWVKYTVGTPGYVAAVKRQSTDSSLITIVVNQDTSGATGRLGIITRNRLDTDHSWIVHNGGYNDGDWHNIVGTISGNTRTIYIDGIQRGTDTDGMQSVTNNTANFTIGGFATSGFNSLFFGGSIANVSFYRKALTSTEVTQNFNALKGRFGL